MRASTSSFALLTLLAAPFASADPLLGLGTLGGSTNTNTGSSSGVNLLHLDTSKLLQSVDQSLKKLLNGSVIAQVDLGTNTNQVLDSVTDSLDKILKRAEAEAEASVERRAAPAAAPKMVKLRRRGIVGDADRLIDSAAAEKKRQLDHHAQERSNLANRRAGKRRIGSDHHGVAQDHPDLARRTLSLNDLFTKVNKVITDTTHGTNTVVYTAEGTVGADVKTVEDTVTGALSARAIPEADKVFIKRAYSKQDLFNAVNSILTDTTGGANAIVGTTEVTVGSDVLTVEQILEGLTSN